MEKGRYFRAIFLRWFCNESQRRRATQGCKTAWRDNTYTKNSMSCSCTERRQWNSGFFWIISLVKNKVRTEEPIRRPAHWKEAFAHFFCGFAVPNNQANSASRLRNRDATYTFVLMHVCVIGATYDLSRTHIPCDRPFMAQQEQPRN